MPMDKARMMGSFSKGYSKPPRGSRRNGQRASERRNAFRELDFDPFEPLWEKI